MRRSVLPLFYGSHSTFRLYVALITAMTSLCRLYYGR